MCTKMEQPFYPDSFFSGYSQEYKALKSSGMALNLSGEAFRGLKSQLPHHLRGQDDSPAAYFPGSLQQQQQAETGSSSLKLAAPELERLIVQNSNGVITTTPTPPGQYYYPRGATEEQEGFADGFVKALDDLHKMNHLPPPNVSIGTVAAAAPAAALQAAARTRADAGEVLVGSAGRVSRRRARRALPAAPVGRAGLPGEGPGGPGRPAEGALALADRPAEPPAAPGGPGDEAPLRPGLLTGPGLGETSPARLPAAGLRPGQRPGCAHPGPDPGLLGLLPGCRCLPGHWEVTHLLLLLQPLPSKLQKEKDLEALAALQKELWPLLTAEQNHLLHPVVQEMRHPSGQGLLLGQPGCAHPGPDPGLLGLLPGWRRLPGHYEETRLLLLVLQPPPSMLLKEKDLDHLLHLVVQEMIHPSSQGF